LSDGATAQDQVVRIGYQKYGNLVLEKVHDTLQSGRGLRRDEGAAGAGPSRARLLVRLRHRW